MDKTERTKQLNRIFRLAQTARYYETTPWMTPPVLMGLVGGSAGAIMAFLSVFFPTVHLMMIAFCLIFVGYPIGYLIEPHKTWWDGIFHHLARYEPLDEEAYRHLQKSTSEKTLTYINVVDWVKLERSAMDVPVPIKPDPARDEFVSKRWGLTDFHE